jgi:hypothetical protein
MNFAGLVMVALGLVCAGAAIFNWRWVVDDRRGSLWVLLLGRNGARIFYGIAGAAVVAAGLLATFDVIKIKATSPKRSVVPAASMSGAKGA